MPTILAIESKPVVLFGVTTQYDHLYLVKTITDASGKVTDERVIRGNLADDGSLQTQANIPLASSEDARGSATPAQRHRTVLDLDGRDPNAVWNIMVQHAVNIDKANLEYGVEAYEIDAGGEVNSNTVVASALNAVGINLAQTLPMGVGPGDVPLYNRVNAMFVNDVLNGNASDDVILGGVGNDTLNGGAGNDRLYGQVGNDLLVGGLGNDRLDGGLGADRMDGGDGHDAYYVDSAGDRVIEADLTSAGGVDHVVSRVSFSLLQATGVERLSLFSTGDFNAVGNALSNRVTGNSGDNKLSGRAGNDVLSGGAGHDQLYGSVGSDTLNGGAGNDLLIGGVNNDMLSGGTGIDTFDFNTVAESYAGATTRDEILDFQSTEVIDLSTIDAYSLVAGNQAFSFIGTGAFTAAGQLRFELDGAGNTIVQADVNGDLTADFEVVLRGYTQPLNGGDFVL